MASGVAEVVWTSYEKKNIEEKESYMALMDQEKVDDRIDRDALSKVLWIFGVEGKLLVAEEFL